MLYFRDVLCDYELYAHVKGSNDKINPKVEQIYN